MHWAKAFQTASQLSLILKRGNLVSSRRLQMLVRYNAWANDLMFGVLASLPDGVAEEKRVTAFGNMIHTLNHALVIDRVWQAHLEHRRHGYTARNTAVHPALADLRREQEAMDKWYVAYVDGLPAEKLEEIVRFEFIDGGSGAMCREDIVLHTVNHKTYHRGYVADMLYQAGARPPAMDLPVFIRDVYK